MDTIGFVSGGIEFGNDEVLLVGECLTELFPDWDKLLAVSAPWGVVLNKNILGWVHDDLFPLFSDEGEDSSGVVFWDLLRFEVWLDGTRKDIISELTNNGDGQISWLGIALEFLHVLWEDSSKSWHLFLGDTHELSESLLDSSGNIGIREEHLTLVGSGGFRENSHEGGILIGGAISEQHKGWLLLSENGINFLLGELKNGWDHEWLNPGGESLLIGSSGVWDDWLLEVSEESDSWTGNLVLLGAGIISNMEELNFIFSVGESNMDIIEKRSSLSTEVSKDEFGILSFSLKSIAVNLGGWWSRLLGDPLDDSVLSSTTGVFLLFTLPKLY